MNARSAIYHKSASADALWIGALRKLHGSAARLSDGRIAELLSMLSAKSIRTLNAEGWTIERVEDLAAADNGVPPLAWTARQVRYYRQALGLRARCAGSEAARAALQIERRKRQSESGWWHLLPDSDTGEDGWLLWQRECMVLSLLREHGPMTRAQLLTALGPGRHQSRYGRTVRSVFVRLVETRMVEVLSEGGATLFALSEAVAPPARWRETSIEANYG